MTARDLFDVRSKAAAALAPVTDTDPSIHMDLVDAWDPPCVMLAWSDPWLEPKGPGCLYDARMDAVCIAGRLEPGPGVTTLETLVAYVVDRLDADDYPWPLQTVSAPRVFVQSGINYLAARVTYRLPVTLSALAPT